MDAINTADTRKITITLDITVGPDATRDRVAIEAIRMITCCMSTETSRVIKGEAVRVEGSGVCVARA